MSDTALVWFRRDLRIQDNPALLAAAQRHERVLPVYIHAPDEEAPWAPGAASRWWLHHSLKVLDQSLTDLGAPLIICRGSIREVLSGLIADTGASALYWNRCYEPAARTRDTEIKQWVKQHALQVESFNAALLNEPWEIQTGQGTPYRVFTAYWKSCRAEPVADPLPAPARLNRPEPCPDSISLDALELLPRISWDGGLAETWTPGEVAARRQLARFLDQSVTDYTDDRDRPGITGTSLLSPFLHFGEISPRQIFAAGRERETSDGLAGFERELYWREFAHHLLYHFPETAERPLDRRFSDFPWLEDHAEALAAWQQGRTGIPLVDAGMRELWHTGWMHNRVRMVVASLLTKNLLIPWQEGARWFWDTLVDADLANNTLGWQWTAGCGADAAPYFRVFNPVRQAERFDPDGSYVRRWVPEYGSADYPEPMVDLQASRKRALSIWDDLKRR